MINLKWVIFTAQYLNDNRMSIYYLYIYIYISLRSCLICIYIYSIYVYIIIYIIYIYYNIYIYIYINREKVSANVFGCFNSLLDFIYICLFISFQYGAGISLQPITLGIIVPFLKST